jgi:hypothetical protein
LNVAERFLHFTKMPKPKAFLKYYYLKRDRGTLDQKTLTGTNGHNIIMPYVLVPRIIIGRWTRFVLSSLKFLDIYFNVRSSPVSSLLIG